MIDRPTCRNEQIRRLSKVLALVIPNVPVLIQGQERSAGGAQQ